MPLSMFTTTVEAAKTVNEIEAILAKHKVTSTHRNYDTEGMITSLSFVVSTPTGPWAVKLPVDPDAVLKVLAKQGVAWRYRTRAQAVRIAWRIAKNWIEAQMAILDYEMVRMEQIMLPYVEMQDGKSVFQHYIEKQERMMIEAKQ